MKNISKQELEDVIQEGLSTSQLGKRFGLSQTGIRYWLRKYSLRTIPSWNLENRYKYSDSELLKTWKKSDSINQFLLNLGVGTGGGAWYHYQKRLTNLGADFSNLKIKGNIRGGQKTAALRNAESIKRRVRLRRPTLKKSMDLANMIYECAKCGVSEWLGKKLKLHIHHIDEDKTNNRISNLEYLCPNCHGIQHYTEK